MVFGVFHFISCQLGFLRLRFDLFCIVYSIFNLSTQFNSDYEFSIRSVFFFCTYLTVKVVFLFIEFDRIVFRYRIESDLICCSNWAVAGSVVHLLRLELNWVLIDC